MPILADWRITTKLDSWNEIAIEQGDTVICAVWPLGESPQDRAEQLRNAKMIACTAKLVALTERVAAAFEGTDSPLGSDARAILKEIQG